MLLSFLLVSSCHFPTTSLYLPRNLTFTLFALCNFREVLPLFCALPSPFIFLFSWANTFVSLSSYRVVTDDHSLQLLLQSLLWLQRRFWTKRQEDPSPAIFPCIKCIQKKGNLLQKGMARHRSWITCKGLPIPSNRWGAGVLMKIQSKGGKWTTDQTRLFYSDLCLARMWPHREQCSNMLVSIDRNILPRRQTDRVGKHQSVWRGQHSWAGSKVSL